MKSLERGKFGTDVGVVPSETPYSAALAASKASEVSPELFATPSRPAVSATLRFALAIDALRAAALARLRVERWVEHLIVVQGGRDLVRVQCGIRSLRERV